MALLGERGAKGGRVTAACGALSLAALAAACVLTGKGPPRDHALAFSHEIHVQREGLECVNCHENVSVSDEPGMPASDTCALCHSKLDAEKPPERHIETLYASEGFRAAHLTALGSERVFSHQRHVQAGLDCGACHRDIEQNQRVDASLSVPMERCTACHAERQVASACSTCHREIDESWKPQSHAQDWKRQHGHAFRAAGREPADRCSTCHQDSTCQQCHQEEAPLNHTGTWRLAGHGLAARMDRGTCAACHQPDSCERCHADTPPLSHVGLWGAPKDTHCLGCHFPLSSNGCAVCHKGTPSHLEAPPKPSWHTPVMNCVQCHGLVQPLPHVNKGDNCNICHL